MLNSYAFRNLSESEIGSLLGAVATQRLYRRTAVKTNVISIDTVGTFLDGTPKYFAKIQTDDVKLVERFINKKNKE